jgi:hypothetical protein
VIFHSFAANRPAFLALQEELAAKNAPIVRAQYGSRGFPGAYDDPRSALEMGLKYLSLSGHGGWKMRYCLFAITLLNG